MLKAQDLLVALKLSLEQPARGTDLAEALTLSVAETYLALKRLVTCHLAREAMKGALPLVIRRNLLEFLVHGVRYTFPATLGEPTRGFPTAHAAPPLSQDMLASDLPPVWPSPRGTVRGFALSPLYKSVPEAALRDPRLYELLALVDAVRAGTARERLLASKLLEERLMTAATTQEV